MRCNNADKGRQSFDVEARRLAVGGSLYLLS